MRDEDQASAVRGGGMPSDLGRLLLRAHRDFGARALAQLRARGVADLGLAHTALLATLDPAGGGTSVTLLAERAAMTKQAIGELAIDLERGGYVTRAPDPADRRATIVTITAAGRRALRAALEAKRAVEADYAAAIGARRLAALHEALVLLVDRPRPDG